MEKIKRFLYKKIEALLIFIVLLVFHINLFITNCNLYKSLSFDNQALFTWDYSAMIGLLPFKDVFYPYGILPYFISTSYIAQIIYYLLFIIALLLFFELFRKLFKKRLIVYVLFFMFVVFIDKFIGTEQLIRYGLPSALISMFTFSIDYKIKFIKWKKILLYSFFSGLLFGLLNDSGIYLFLSIILVLFTYPLVVSALNILKEQIYYKVILKNVFVALLGVFFGFLPFLIYLISKNLLSSFVQNFLRLSEYFFIAKIPFTPGLISFENIFTVGILLVTVVVIILKLSKLVPHETRGLFLQICIIFILVIVEQKNVIRSTDRLISFFGLILLYLLLVDFIYFFKKYEPRITGFFVILLIFLVFGGSFSNVNLSNSRVKTLSPQACVEENIGQILKDDELLSLKKELQKLRISRVFSYPGDPVIYSLLNQKPTYYFSVYEGSSKISQNATIEDINEDKIEYVVINTKIKAIQDSVPNLIRTPMLTRFIVNNYYPVRKLGDFLILKKDSSSDFFNSNLDNSFKNFLLSVNLEAIPFSEGYYKESKLNQVNLTYSAKDINSLNDFLSKNRISSSDELLVVVPVETYTQSSFIITTDDNKQTRISFNGCHKDKSCIVNLDNIPLFYENRVIKQVKINNFYGDIKIYKNPDNSAFW
ncbi:MAG: hypothetical protein A2W22_03860 [Candidatus Levybacteria bacterium RBG_16_35_11]|nr:MAG: hypothetical protein A2W22_03860 [Candidatus Levybacteria bacterium RBG_16_35_11]